MPKQVKKVEIEGAGHKHFPRSAEAMTVLFLAHYIRRYVGKMPLPLDKDGKPVARESTADFNQTIQRYKKFAGLLHNRKPKTPEWWALFLFIIFKFVVSLVKRFIFLVGSLVVFGVLLGILYFFLALALAKYFDIYLPFPLPYPPF